MFSNILLFLYSCDSCYWVKSMHLFTHFESTAETMAVLFNHSFQFRSNATLRHKMVELLIILREHNKCVPINEVFYTKMEYVNSCNTENTRVTSLKLAPI